MPRDIRVGDKVRLLGWEGQCDGYHMLSSMQRVVGEPATVTAIVSEVARGVVPDSERMLGETRPWHWPISKLEPLDAPRPSAWTKTSEGKPDVGEWVLGWWTPVEGHGNQTDYCVVQRVEEDSWRREHADGDEEGPLVLGFAAEPDYWQPLPAPPEVSK